MPEIFIRILRTRFLKAECGRDHAEIPGIFVFGIFSVWNLRTGMAPMAVLFGF
jgi:hypothetical protein